MTAGTASAPSMSTKQAVAWLLPGGTFTIIDIWMSIQSVFGLVDHDDLISRIAAAVCGFLLTTIAVGEPVLRDWAAEPALRRAGFWLVWTVAVVLDLATTIMGAIWYGALHQPWGSAIEWDRIHFKVDRSPETLVYVVLVLLAAWSCRQFGVALRVLTIERPPGRPGRY